MKNTLRVCLATLALSAGVVQAQTCPPPPSATPTPIGPSGPTFDTHPTFSWNAVAGYAYYVFKLLYADPNGGYVTPPGNLITVYGTSFTPPSDLPVGPGMRWQVKVACIKPDGNWGYGQYGPELFFNILEDTQGGSCGECFGGLNSCLDACGGGVCERRVNCGPSGYKCFC